MGCRNDKKIELGYEELKDNIEMRNNLDLRINGNTRKELYKQIILKNKDNIKKVCCDTTLEKYPNINNIISIEIKPHLLQIRRIVL